MPPSAAPSTDGSFHANATLLAALTGGSRILGFARDLCIAVILGAGPLADAFFLAFRIPNLLRRLFAEGAWSLAFVPAFSRLAAQGSQGPQGLSRAFAFSRAVLLWVLLLSGALCLLCMLLPQTLATLMAPGLRNDPFLLAETARMLRLCAPYGVCIMAASVSMGVLNARGHFLAPALAPVAMNLTLMAAALLAWLLGLSPAHTLAWAVPVAGFLQWLVQQPALLRHGFTLHGPLQPRDPEVRRLGRDVGPVLLGASGLQLAGLLATLAAAGLPHGGVSWLYYADRLVQLPLGVFSIAVSMAALPELAGLAAAGRTDAFDAVLRKALGLILCISLPAAAGLAALAEPITALLFGHGAFDAAAVQGTGQTLLALALGLPAFAAIRPLASACHARNDTRLPLRAALAGLLLFVACIPVALHLEQTPLLALALSLGGWCNALLLHLGLRRLGLLPPTSATRRNTLLCLGLSLALWAAAKGGLLLWTGLTPWSPRLGVVVLLPLLTASYLGAGLLLKLEPITDLRRLVLRRG